MQLLAPVTTTAKVFVRTARVGVRLGLGAADRVIGLVKDDDHAAPDVPRSASAPSAARGATATPVPEVPEPVARDVPPPATPPAADPFGPPSQPEFEPTHLDEPVAELVREDADEGYGDGAGAGANLRVDAPWDGYDEMTAADVTDRLAVADAATLAAVRLYETTHRDRKTVVAEVDRRLAAVS